VKPIDEIILKNKIALDGVETVLAKAESGIAFAREKMGNPIIADKAEAMIFHFQEEWDWIVENYY
jgi:hypothetical protein